jgi:hypothetical protein
MIPTERALHHQLRHDGGKHPSYALASGLLGHARNTIGFVGYCDPDTPGGELLAAKTRREDFMFERPT